MSNFPFMPKNCNYLRIIPTFLEAFNILINIFLFFYLGNEPYVYATIITICDVIKRCLCAGTKWRGLYFLYKHNWRMIISSYSSLHDFMYKRSTTCTCFPKSNQVIWITIQTRFKTEKFFYTQRRHYKNGAYEEARVYAEEWQK